MTKCRNLIAGWSLAVLTALPMAGLAQENRVVDTPLTLDVFFPDWGNYPYQSTWPVERRAAELTGVSLRSVTDEPVQDRVQSVNRIIRSGDLPDIIGGGELRTQFNMFGPQGAFIQLDALIPEHAPHLHAFFQANPDLLKAAEAADGHLYYVPYFQEGTFTRAYFIRQDWLDKLGLDQPQTADEFYEVLVAFKTQDPNGNGLADEVPFFARDFDDLLRLAPLWDARSSGSNAELQFYIQNNQITHGLIQPEFRTVVRHLARWYREGLIAEELLTKRNAEREYFLSENLGGSTHDWFASTSSFNDSLKSVIPGFKLVPMIPPASATGRRIEETRRDMMTEHGWAIAYTNPDPIATLKYFDFWFSEQGYRLQNFGIEGVHYDMVDGVPVLRPELLHAERPVNAVLLADGAMISRGSVLDYDQEWQWTNEIAREGIEAYSAGDFLLESYFPAAMNEREQGIYDRYWDGIRIHMKDQIAAWIMGKGDVDSEWGGYLAELDDLGMPAVIDVLNNARWRSLYSR